MGIETALQQPPAIVARAENDAAWAKLPGIEEFAAGLKQAVQDAREKSALARVASWDIIRRCYEYGNRPEVRALIASWNLNPDGHRKNGRPFVGHRLAMEAVAERCAVSGRAIRKWQKSFNEALRSGALNYNQLMELSSINPPMVADRLEEIEARIEAQGAEQGADDSEDEDKTLKPEELGERIGKRILRRAKLASEETMNPPMVQGLVRALCPVLYRHGYTVHWGNKRSSR
jgi:hypothetical protein